MNKKQNNIPSSPSSNSNRKSIYSNRNKDNDADNILNDIFPDIKQKLEDDYQLSNSGWNDSQLKDKIKKNMNEEIKNLIISNKDTAIEKLGELIGEELLDL